MNAPSLSRVAQNGAPLPDRIVLYGSPGWGKTSFSANLPRPIFLMTPGEDRLLKLIEQGLVSPTSYFANGDGTPLIAESWGQVLAAIKELTTQAHDYSTFVLDTGNGAERLAQEAVCENEFGGDWGEGGFNSFGRGEKIAANKLWFPFLAQLDLLRSRRRMRIVLCCHAGVRPTKNPDGPDYDKIEPALTRLAWGATSKWADMILCGALETVAQKDDPKNKVQKAKGKGGKVRLLHCSPSAAYEAKNCHRLPQTIRLGDDPLKAFDSFKAAFPPKKPEQEQPPTPPTAPAAPNGNGEPYGVKLLRGLQTKDKHLQDEFGSDAGGLLKFITAMGSDQDWKEPLDVWQKDRETQVKEWVTKYEGDIKAAHAQRQQEEFA